MFEHIVLRRDGTEHGLRVRGCAVVVAALAVAAMVGVGSPAAAQPVQWAGNGHYYELVRSQVTWTQARDAARSASYLGLSGHLATIGSQGENDFIRDSVAVDELAWIGFTDAADEGTWEWVTGEEVVYENWAPGEPNDSGDGEDYGQFTGFFGDQQGQWNDIANDDGGGRFYVVEYAAEGVPAFTPAGLLILALAVLALGLWWLR